METAIDIGGYHKREQTLARRLWDHLPNEALLLDDRGFSYDEWTLLVRLKNNLILRPIERLAEQLVGIIQELKHQQQERSERIEAAILTELESREGSI